MNIASRLERLAVIKAQSPVKDAAALMSKAHTDLVVVCDHGDMVGLSTKTDIGGRISKSHLRSRLHGRRAKARRHLLQDTRNIARRLVSDERTGLATCSDSTKNESRSASSVLESLAGAAVRVGKRERRLASRSHIWDRMSLDQRAHRALPSPITLSPPKY